MLFEQSFIYNTNRKVHQFSTNDILAKIKYRLHKKTLKPWFLINKTIIFSSKKEIFHIILTFMIQSIG